MTFSGAAAGAFANPNFEGMVFGSFLVNPEELFGKNAFAMTYDTK